MVQVGYVRRELTNSLYQVGHHHTNEVPVNMSGSGPMPGSAILEFDSTVLYNIDRLRVWDWKWLAGMGNLQQCMKEDLGRREQRGKKPEARQVWYSNDCRKTQNSPAQLVC